MRCQRVAIVERHGIGERLEVRGQLGDWPEGAAHEHLREYGQGDELDDLELVAGERGGQDAHADAHHPKQGDGRKSSPRLPL